MFPTFGEQRYIRIAKTIDRLHRIADSEKGVIAVGLPTLGEQFKKAHLAVGGILKLVHQQVANSVVEVQCKVRRARFISQTGASAQLQLSEIDCALTNKYIVKADCTEG